MYHFTAPKGWLNDPNGVIHHNGVYHLFYQHNPYGSLWANMHWGHATSRDLVHWQHQPIALAPSPNPDSYDAGGVFSGCCVIDDEGTPVIIYTGVGAPNHHPQVPALAFGDADLQTWQKYAGNPIIQPPSQLNIVGFRDHTVWKEGDGWHQLIGSGIRGQGGCVFHYTSPNLRQWRYAGVALQGHSQQNNGRDTGTIWECPDFFSLAHLSDPAEPAHVLLISPIPLNQVQYFVGGWQNGQITPHSMGVLDYGTALWAPQSFTDSQGRRIMFGWLRESRPQHEQRASAWNGVMTLPRILSLSADGKRVLSNPAPEVQQLRRSTHRMPAQALIADQPHSLPIRSACCEIEIEIAVQTAHQIILSVRQSPADEEVTRIIYNHIDQCLWLDTTHARQNSASGQANAAPLVLTDHDTLRLRVFVDDSVIEVYANEGVCLSGRIYPARTDSDHISIRCNKGEAFIQQCVVWSMASTIF